MIALPEDSDKLREILKNARTPEISEFNGEYLVDMLTMLPSFSRFSHRKVFYSENGIVSGYNILFNRIWGYFSLEKGFCGGPDSLNAVVINYNRGENLFFTKRIRDYVRCIESGRLYIGRFQYLLMGRECFLGYFSLSKLQ